MEKLNHIVGLGESIKNISENSCVFSAEVRKYKFGFFSLNLKSIAINRGRWWPRPLSNPLDDGVLGSSAGVFKLFTVSKIFSYDISIFIKRGIQKLNTPSKILDFACKFFPTCILYLLEKVHGWESFNTEFFGQLLLISSINLTEHNFWSFVRLCKFLSCSGIFWSKCFAVTTKILE